MSIMGNITNPLNDPNDTRASDDHSAVGNYRAMTGSGVTVELSSTSRAGIYQHTFPSGEGANIVVDVSHILPSFRGQGRSQNYLGGSISSAADDYEGYGSYNNKEDQTQTTFWRMPMSRE